MAEPTAPFFETPRLIAKEWHSLDSDDWSPSDLRDVVGSILTEAVTAPLLPAWHGSYTPERAGSWIADRDSEGTTLLVLSKASREPVGLVLFSTLTGPDPEELEVRLGYLLREESWGLGFATELVRGFVDWCKCQPVVSITAGVEQSSAASTRVLEKSGFLKVRPTEATSHEIFYTLRLDDSESSST